MRPHDTTSLQQFVMLCACGCGEPTLISCVSGDPNRFKRGHNSRVAPTKRVTPNNVRIVGDVAYLSLNAEQVAIVDAADLPRIGHLHWNAAWQPRTQSYYVTSREHGRTVQLHRLVMDAPPGMDVDHIHGNPLDNRRSELRVITRSQNLQNRSKLNNNNTTGFRGVTFSYSHGRRRYRGQLERKGHKAVVKDFPFTPEGLRDAAGWVSAQRAILMPYSEQDQQSPSDAAHATSLL